MQHPDVQQRPNVGHVGAVMWSLGVLKHTPLDAGVLEQMCIYTCGLFQASAHMAECTAAPVGNVLGALSVLKHPLKDGNFMDDYCMYIHSLLHSLQISELAPIQILLDSCCGL